MTDSTPLEPLRLASQFAGGTGEARRESLGDSRPANWLASVKGESAYGLAFETSSLRGSVALGRGPGILTTRRFTETRRHAVDFLPAVDAMCKAHGVTPADIGQVFVSAGPGSFTGLRIGITAARMIALAVGARVVAVPTLEVIAQNAVDASDPPQRLVVILDAKRSRVYAATFVRQGPGYLPEVREEILAPAVEADPGRYLADCGPHCAVLGEGVVGHRSAVEASSVRVLPETLYPARCETVYRLGYARAARGQFADPRSLVPIYVRPPEAEEKWEKRQRDLGAQA